MRKYDEEISNLQKELEAQREDLAELEAGDLQLQEKRADGPWIDVTETQTELVRGNVVKLEQLIQAYEKINILRNSHPVS